MKLREFIRHLEGIQEEFGDTYDELDAHYQVSLNLTSGFITIR